MLIDFKKTFVYALALTFLGGALAAGTAPAAHAQKAPAGAPSPQGQRSAAGPSSTTAKKQQAFGIVYRDANGNRTFDQGDEPLQGVEVSNLSDIYRTGADGAFTIPVDDPDVVFVIKPSGYQFALRDDREPDFYYLHYPDGSSSKGTQTGGLKYDGLAPTGPLPDTLFFPMHATDEESTLANVVGDPQIPRPREDLFFRDDVVPGLMKTDADFSIFLGDIADNNLDIYPYFQQSVAPLNQPLYMVFGNHDVNYRAPGNPLSAETFRAHFGPDYYAFNYGDSHFVVLNDVDYDGWNGDAGKKGDYDGGLDARQMAWFRQDIAQVPAGRHVYLVTHIPIHPRFFEKENLATLLDVVKAQKAVTNLSGHLHGFLSWSYDEVPGWEGPDGARGYSLGAACGSWWSGPFAADSIPAATMTDGVPNGFFRFTFTQGTSQHTFVPSRRPRDFQMRVSTPHDYIRRDSLGQGPLVVNVFTGDERARVTAQVDQRATVDTLRQFTGYDPFIVRTSDRRVNRDDWHPGPAETDHLWKADLPTDLSLGTHTVEVTAVLPNGKTYRADHLFQVVKKVPTPQPTRAAE